MGYIVLGCIGFGFLYIFDYNKVKKIHSSFNVFFAVGVSLIGYASLQLYLDPTIWFSVDILVSGIFSVFALLAAIQMFYSLFGALPFKTTYVSAEANQTIDTGMYALCRHPGVWGFFFLYLSSFLATGNGLMLIACVVWTAMDIIHVWIQDRYFFPKTLIGYTDYQRTTPFLLFNVTSITKCIRTFRK